VTFEQWWASLINQPIPQLRPTFKDCWNKAQTALCERIKAESQLPETLRAVRRAHFEVSAE
jgi:hypothetical protein